MDGTWDKTDEYYGEKGLTECLKRMAAINDPSEAIVDLLAFLGEKCFARRAYIFEKSENHTFSNTYEWCAPGTATKKMLLQNESLDMISGWLELFEQNQTVVIKNTEDIKADYPQLYATLKSEDIDSLAAAPVRIKGELVGFIGVDAPDLDRIDKIMLFLSKISYFASFELERRSLNDQLEYVSDHDQLTGAYNRQAYRDFLDDFPGNASVGLLYSDISGLKQVNADSGYQQGDQMICFWYKVLKETFPTAPIYRVGGDEFAVICVGSREKDFKEAVSKLQAFIFNNENHLATGSVWEAEAPADLRSLLAKAEQQMYADKALHYHQINPVTGQSRDRRQPVVYNSLPEKINRDGSEELAQYLHNNYFDPLLFFKALSLSEYYPYIGDLQSNLFYVSDEMRDVFGLSSNIVSDLVSVWGSRITDPKDAEIFREDIAQILRGEKDVHDLYYRIRDKKGDDIWVHCHGLIKWNQDRTKPLFFAGGIAHQKKDFTVDSMTNFPKEYAALQKIRELQEQKEKLTTIGFTLNNFSEINELRGRHAANLFLGKAAKSLAKSFDNRLMFYRLDGMRFLAIVLPGCPDSPEELVRQIREAVSEVYYGSNIMVQAPCSFAVISENGEENLPQDILVNMMALLTQAKNTPEKEYLTYSREDVYFKKAKAQMMMELNKNVLDGFKNFRIAIQPVVSTQDMKVISGEVLLRWSYEGKDVSPSIFVPMLENSRLILKVGQWVLEQAVRTCNRVLTYLPDFYLAVNASYYQIMDPGFLPFVEETLKKYNFSGKHLVLEMTETHYDEAPAKVRQFVENCRELGIRVAIDDFGDGYASLAFLIKYPAAVVKLDRSLINEMAASDDNINFIASIVYACHRFGKKVCAEGVETEEEFSVIKASGCDLIQGYYFYRPLELKNFYELLPGK